MNKAKHSEISTTRQSDFSTLHSSRKSKTKTKTKKWTGKTFIIGGGATMNKITRQNNSPETRRLVEQRNELSRPGTLRRRYDNKTREQSSRCPSRMKKGERILPKFTPSSREEHTGWVEETNQYRKIPNGRYGGRQHTIAWIQPVIR